MKMFSLLVLGLIGVACLLGCDIQNKSPEPQVRHQKRFEDAFLVEVVESEEREFFELEKDDKFSFCYGYGGGPGGLQTIGLSPNRDLKFQKRAEGKVKETSVHLSMPEFSELIAFLNSIRILDLECVYFGQDVLDGKVQLLYISQGNKNKKVWCYGYSPIPLEILEERMSELLAKANPNWTTVIDPNSHLEVILLEKKDELLKDKEQKGKLRQPVGSKNSAGRLTP